MSGFVGFVNVIVVCIGIIIFCWMVVFIWFLIWLIVWRLRWMVMVFEVSCWLMLLVLL